MTATYPPASARGLLARAISLLGVFAALLGVLSWVARPWYLGWGARPEEQTAALPGDELVPATNRGTRAITIAAPAPVVFAWVSQLGQDRAGFYSYTLLENLAGSEMPDVRRLDPALQRWSAGDKLWMYPRDELEGKGHATLLLHEPGRALVFGTHSPADPPGSAATGIWSFVVEPLGPSSTRLLTRSAGSSMPSLLGVVYTRALFEPLHFAMERRMLEGIRGLAEGRPIPPARDALQLSTWLLSFVLFVSSAGLVLLGRQHQRRLVAFAAAGVTFQIVTLAQPSPALGLALLSALCLVIWPPSWLGERCTRALVAKQI